MRGGHRGTTGGKNQIQMLSWRVYKRNHGKVTTCYGRALAVARLRAHAPNQPARNLPPRGSLCASCVEAWCSCRPSSLSPASSVRDSCLPCKRWKVRGCPLVQLELTRSMHRAFGGVRATEHVLWLRAVVTQRPRRRLQAAGKRKPQQDATRCRLTAQMTAPSA